MIRVLHVEDEILVHLLIKKNLIEVESDMEITCVNSGKDAIDLLAKESFDCVISDYQMPGINGLELLKILRKKKKRVPFIFLTGQGNEEIAAEAFRLGADDYFTKEEGFAHYERITNSINKQIRAHQEEFKRLKVENDLQMRQRQYSDLVETSHDLIFKCDDKGCFTYLNPAWEHTLGYREDEMLGHPFKEFKTPEQAEKDLMRFQSILKGQDTFGYETVYISKDGKPVNLLFNAKLLLDSEGNLIGTQGIAHDITVRKKIEGELRWYEYFVSNSKEMMALVDMDFSYLVVNEAYSSAFRKTQDELIGKKSSDIFGEVFFNTIVKPNAERCMAGKDVNYQEWFEFPKAKSKYMDITYIPYIVDNEVKGFMVNGRDITALKKTEERIKESEKKYRQVVETTNDLITRVDAEGKFLFINHMSEKILGLPPEKCIGLSAFEYIHPDDKENEKKIFAKWLAERVTDTSLESRWVNPNDGQIFNFMWSVNIQYDANGHFTGVNSIGRDITKLKLEEKELKKLLKLNQVILDAFPCVALLLRANQEIVASNLAAKEVGAYPGKKCFETWGQRSDPCPWCRAPIALSTQKKIHIPVEGLGKIWDTYWIPIEKDLYMHFAFDVTEQSLSEKQLERLNIELIEKSKEMEGFLYITSHDLRSPLITIEGFAKRLDYVLKKVKTLIGREEIPPSLMKEFENLFMENMKESVEYINSCVKKMNNLLNALSEMSRIGRIPITITDVDMNRLITKIKQTYEFQLQTTGATLKIEELPSCKGDKKQIDQVFSNLLGNALKYLNPKRKGFIAVSGKIVNDKAIYCVEDNGIGIPPNLHTRIFEPFHRVRPTEGIGEGLGLAIVHKIIMKHGGMTWVESKPDKGSKFFFSLPIE